MNLKCANTSCLGPAETVYLGFTLCDTCWDIVLELPHKYTGRRLITLTGYVSEYIEEHKVRHIPDAVAVCIASGYEPA